MSHELCERYLALHLSEEGAASFSSLSRIARVSHSQQVVTGNRQRSLKTASLTSAICCEKTLSAIDKKLTGLTDQ